MIYFSVVLASEDADGNVTLTWDDVEIQLDLRQLEGNATPEGETTRAIPSQQLPLVVGRAAAVGWAGGGSLRSGSSEWLGVAWLCSWLQLRLRLRR